MRHSGRVDPIVKIRALTPPQIPYTRNTHLRNSWVFPLALLIFLHTPNIAWAEENYYQIINGSVDAINNNFITDRGYSVYVNYDGRRFLYDVGYKKKSFLGNMKAAGISLAELDFVALSHRHEDHTRGWGFLRREQPLLPIYVPPGNGFSNIAESTEVIDYLKLSPNIYLIHTHDESGSKYSNVYDELSLLIVTKSGPYLFTTNSHTDFFTKIEKAKDLSGQKVIFHSGHTGRRVSPDDTIVANAKKMKSMGVKRVSPSHSAPGHDKIFEEIFGTEYMPAIVGKKVPLEPVP